MGRRKAVPAEVPAGTIQEQMDAVRVEIARLRRQEGELVTRLAARARADETAMLRFLGSVMMADLDPDQLPPEGSEHHGTALRDFQRRNLYFGRRIRATMTETERGLPLMTALLARLDAQAAQGHNAGSAGSPGAVHHAPDHHG